MRTDMRMGAAMLKLVYFSFTLTTRLGLFRKFLSCRNLPNTTGFRMLVNSVNTYDFKINRKSLMSSLFHELLFIFKNLLIIVKPVYMFTKDV
jgi:hypothetical protein